MVFKRSQMSCLINISRIILILLSIGFKNSKTKKMYFFNIVSSQILNSMLEVLIPSLMQGWLYFCLSDSGIILCTSMSFRQIIFTSGLKEQSTDILQTLLSDIISEIFGFDPVEPLYLWMSLSVSLSVRLSQNCSNLALEL